MDPPEGNRVSARASIAVLLVLIVLGCGRIASSYGTLNQTYDEPLHVAVGMEWLSKGTYTYGHVHPPLGEVFMAMGPYLAGVRSQSHPNFWDEGDALLYAGNHYWRNLTLAR